MQRNPECEKHAMAAGKLAEKFEPELYKRKPSSGEAGLSDGDECLGDYSSISRGNA
jgi:hypothetical protein